jgi:site-specific DNA recombinase
VICAIYCRKSNEQERGASGASESVERQLAHGTEFATARGWTVEYTYADDAVSGAEFAKLHQRKQMVDDAEAGKFQALVISEQSRLGHDMIESVYTIKLIADSGVAIWSYLDATEISVEDEVAQVVTMLKGFSAASERRQASKRVYDSALQRVRAGYVTGARCFGYDHVEVSTPTTHVERRVNPDQAAIVERIFTMYVSGRGATRIREILNREHVPAPRPADGWSETGVLYVLKNSLYRGEIVWNKMRATVQRGKKRRVRRPEKEWIRTTDERLRIISDDLWTKAQAILTARRKSIPRSPKTGKLLGRPSWFDGHSDFLWTGFGTCAVCSGNIRIQNRRSGKFYVCGRYRQRGATICANDVLVRPAPFDEALRVALREILNPDVIALALSRAVDRLRSDQASSLDRKTMVEKELASIRQRVDRLVDAIADGSMAGDEIKARLQIETVKRHALDAELASLGTVGKVASLDTAAITRDLRAKVSDVTELLGQKTPQARAMLRKVLVGPILVHPVRRAGRRGFRFEGRVSFARLLSGEVLNTWQGCLSVGTGCLP